MGSLKDGCVCPHPNVIPNHYVPVIFRKLLVWRYLTHRLALDINPMITRDDSDMGPKHHIVANDYACTCRPDSHIRPK